MTIDKLHPTDLKEGLSTFPLLHLLPKQDLAPLISFSSIDAVSSDIDDLGIDSKSVANQTRDEMNSNPQYFSKVIDYLANDFHTFEDNELDDLVFKKPLIAKEDATTKEPELELPPFEKRLFEDMNEIDDSSIQGNNTIGDQLHLDESELSIRPDYDARDVSSLTKHNKKFDRKFEYERAKMDWKNDTEKSLSLEDSRTISPENSKREIEFAETPPISEAKRKQRTTYLESDHLKKQSLEELVELIHNIGLIDEESENEKYMSKVDDNKLLTSQTLIIILDHLLRLLDDPIIDNIDLEYLLRIERLCMRSVIEGLKTHWNELIVMSDVTSLEDFMANYSPIQKLFELALNSTIASKIILVIFGSRRSDKQLFLDDYLKSIIDLIYLLIQDVILPFATKKMLDVQITNTLRSFYLSLTTDICTIVDMLSGHIERNEVDEYLLTRLEYLSVFVVFAESNSKERTSIIGVSNLENLRVSSCKVLTIIFENYPDQRLFIFNEILSNFDKLPTQKTAARQFKLNRGGNVQLSTVLLLGLLQSFNTSSFAQDANDIRQGNGDENDKSFKKNMKKKIMGNVSVLFEEVTKFSNDIATFLVSNLYKNHDNHQKQLFELLLEDLLTIVVFPEWPSAEILLTSLFKALLYAIQSGTYSTQMETSVLELTGIIGVKIFELKKKNITSHQLNINSSCEDIHYFSACFIDSLEYVQLQAIKNRSFIAAFRLLILKFVFQLKSLIQYNNKDDDTRESQLAALNSDNDYLYQPLVQNDVNLLFDKLLNMLADDEIKLNQALSSNKDTLSISSYTQILLTQELVTLLDSFVNLIVSTLDSTKVKSKTKAIRTISSLIDIDPSLLVSPKIQESVSKRLLDTSPLVRDAVIELISRFMLSRPEVIDQFHKPICDRLNDDSIQVRKRVIRLSRDMYLKTDKVFIKSQIALKMLRRLDDEDDAMADIATSYLLELWFTSLTEGTKSATIGNFSIVTLEKAEVMMEIISAGGRTSAYFERFLTDYVLINLDPRVMQAVKLIIDKTLDLVIDCVDAKFHTRVEKALMLLSTFAKCDGSLMTQDQLISLQPYLVDENSGEAVCAYCLQILKYVLPCLSVLRPEFVDAAQSYLLRRLTKFNVKELHEAMPCVWRLCYMSNDTIKLANASISCMKLIKPFIDLSKKGEKVDSNTKLHRLLHLLGCFGTYCRLEKHRNIYLKSRIGIKENETVISVITKFLLFFCGSTFLPQIRKIAVKNIICVCSAHPKLFMSDVILKVLDREFEDSDVEIKRTIIQGFIDFLRNEDNNSKLLNGVQVKSSTEIKLDVAVFHGDTKSYVNDGICAGIIQRYLKKILEFCLEESDELAILPVQFVQLVVKLGFANPKICIPYVIALEASTNPHIRHITFELHKELFEKHESLTDTSYLEGLKLAVRFRKRTSNNIYQESFFIKSLYSIVGGNYSSRKKFIQSISKVFNLNLGYSRLEDNTFQRDTIIYSAFNISAIHFASLEEVLILIHSIDKVISREGLDLSEKISKETYKNSPTCESIAYKRNLCVNAQTLTALVLFRNHLGATHGISNTQIDNYKPNRADLDLRQPPKLVNEVPLPIDTKGLNLALKNTESFSIVYTKFFQAIHEFIE